MSKTSIIIILSICWGVVAVCWCRLATRDVNEQNEVAFDANTYIAEHCTEDITDKEDDILP